MATPSRNGDTGQRWVRRVQYESGLDPGFPDSIAKLRGAENLLGCIQCGTCVGACPVSPYMDLSPRQIIAMTRAGFKDDVLGCFTIWLCASCYACAVACPKQIQITDVMYALKRQAILEGRHPKNFAVPTLAQEFYRQVWTHGRSSEGRLIMALYAKVDPLLMVRNMVLGLRLVLRGRIGIKAESIRDRAAVDKLLQEPPPSSKKKEVAA